MIIFCSSPKNTLSPPHTPINNLPLDGRAIDFNLYRSHTLPHHNEKRRLVNHLYNHSEVIRSETLFFFLFIQKLRKLFFSGRETLFDLHPPVGMMSLDVQGSLKILFSFFCNKYFFTQLRLRMRNKTLLIRRHLIHYWHLSNQTTFHKTTFFPQRRWRQKNWAWKICFLLLAFGSVKGSKIREYIFVFVPKTAERRRRQTIFPCLAELPRENCWWNIVRHGNVDAENCSEKSFQREHFPALLRCFRERRTWSDSLRENHERTVDRRTHSPRLDCSLGADFFLCRSV